VTISSSFLHKVRGRLQRDRELPLAERVRSSVVLAARYLFGAAGGAVFLRECTEVGAGARVIGGRPYIDNHGVIAIGSHAQLQCQFVPVSLRSGPAGRIDIGEFTSINFATVISARQSVSIGRDCSIGPYCVISDTVGSDPDDPSDEALPVELGERVWLAARVTVLPGSKIGAGSVVTAGSVVSGEIPPGVVAGGAPARTLRKLGAHEEDALRAAASSNAEVPASAEAPAPASAAPPSSPTNGVATSGPSELSRQSSLPPAINASGAKTRGLLVSDFTINEFERRLNDPSEGPLLDFEVAPFGQVLPTLMSPPPPGCDVLVVWTRPEAVIPGFGRLLAFEAVPESELLAEVDQFVDLVARAAAGYRSVFVPTWALPPYRFGLGMLEARAGGAYRALTAMNLRLMDRLSQLNHVYVLNTQRWLERTGSSAQHPKLWYMGKVAFHADVFREAARDIKAALAGLSGGARKLLVLDLDDTMWGGIVGDVGWENLRLGGHDSIGEAFVDFQRAAKDLKRRGIVLAIVSKNTESVALEAIRNHPEMVLRESDFVGWRINWQDKARTIAELATELNLGLQSVVFIDDNPVERARVREALPEVFVPEWPEDRLLYRSSLLALRCFDAPALSREDAERTEMYAAERRREAAKIEVGSIDDWLKTLDLVVRVERVNAVNLTRTVQLLNKTNQMNLSTRRVTEAELKDWLQDPNHEMSVISVSDRFGDAGLTGIVSFEIRDGVASIVDFVLSCRVMGRKIEETMVHLVVEAARRHGLARVEALYSPTAKNKPCLEFWARSGFAVDGNLFHWDAAEREYVRPEAVRLDRADIR
jgi:FkbH-like protein